MWVALYPCQIYQSKSRINFNLFWIFTKSSPNLRQIFVKHGIGNYFLFFNIVKYNFTKIFAQIVIVSRAFTQPKHTWYVIRNVMAHGIVQIISWNKNRQINEWKKRRHNNVISLSNLHTVCRTKTSWIRNFECEN